MQQIADMQATEGDFGSTPERLADTLKSSKFTSALVDPPLPPPEHLSRRYLPRYWLTRGYLSVSMLSKCLTIFLLPASALGLIIGSSRTGWAIVAGLAALSLAGVMDVLINDLAPAGWKLPFTRDHRHWIYNGLAIATLALVYFVVRRTGWSPVLLAFVPDLAVAVAVAPLDMLARHKETRP